MSEIILKAVKRTVSDQPTVVFTNRSEYLDYLKEIPDNQEVLVTIAHKRSLDQNKLFWSWIKIIADYIGESQETTKVWLTCKFFGCEEKEIDGQIYTIPVSTSKLNKKDFANGLTQMNIFAFEKLNIILPYKDTLNT